MVRQASENLKQLELYHFKKPIKEDAVQLLSGGFSSARNYRIEDSGTTYLARFMSTQQPLASREKECLITGYVGKIGIGPKAYYQNPQKGILLTEFIQGRNAKSDDMVNEPNCNLIAANIKNLHKTDPAAFPKAVPISVYARETLKRIDSSILQQQLQSFKLAEPLNSLFNCEKNRLTAALIHNDLNPTNILISENKVYFIDWTNAGAGDPFSDISWHAIFFPLHSHNNLLSYYFDEVNIYARRKLLCYYCLRLFLQAFWGIEQAKNLSPDYERLLIDILGQQNLPEPHNLIMSIFTNKLNAKNPHDLLLTSAVMLNFLTHFTKTDIFLSSAKDIISHA